MKPLVCACACALAQVEVGACVFNFAPCVVLWVHAVRYKEWDAYIFDRSRSAGDESDRFTTVNIPFQGVVAALYHEFWNIGLDVLYGLLPERERIFTNRTVKEVIWGYTDPQLLLASEAARVVGVNISSWYPGLSVSVCVCLSVHLCLWVGE
jgi:hypothetical protein